MFVLLVFSSLHWNHLFIWMDPEVVAHDEIIQNKTAYLNVPFFLIRAAIFLGGWFIFRHFLVRNSRRLDEATDNHYFKKNFKLAAGFLVFFLVSESVMSWDWIMSLDPHWFSTLFGWYTFATMFVSGITVIAMITIYLKSRGYLEFVNENHMHIPYCFIITRRCRYVCYRKTFLSNIDYSFWLRVTLIIFCSINRIGTRTMQENPKW